MNTLAKEQLNPDYVAINPQHTVPTLVDDGKSIWDSHAINPYLISKYGKDDSLYPKDLYTRAVIDQRLHFDNGVLFPRFGALVRPIFFENKTEWDPAAVEQIKETFQFLEIFLGDNDYLAGQQLTIADLSIIATVSSIMSNKLFKLDEYPKIDAWIKRMEKLPYFHEINTKALEHGAQIFKAKLEANKAAK